MITRYREPVEEPPAPRFERREPREATPTPPPVEQRKPRSAPMIVRTLAFTLIVLAASYFVAFIRAPAVQFLAMHLGYAAGLPWACSVASAITRDRPALLLLVAILVLLVAPNGVQELSRALVPVGAGLVIGNFIGLGIREERSGEPV